MICGVEGLEGRGEDRFDVGEGGDEGGSLSEGLEGLRNTGSERTCQQHHLEVDSEGTLELTSAQTRWILRALSLRPFLSCLRMSFPS